jgi:hypothetical protein
VNVDRFWLGVCVGILTALMVVELVRFFERHIAFIP